MSRWDDDDRKALERFTFAEGVRPVAREIPCAPQSIYNWISGKTAPLPILQERVRAIVSRLGQPPST